MEQFNSKIYDKYKNLKKRKLLEEEEWNNKRDSAIKNYLYSTEDLIEDLTNEKDQLHSEMALMQEQYAECQKLLFEESQKTKELSNEVGRLQNLLLQKNDNRDSALPRSPYASPRVRLSDTYKGSSKKTPNSCAIQSEVRYKETTIVPYESHQEEQYVDFYNDPGNGSLQSDCCRRNMTSSGSTIGKGQTTCAFQTLTEFLVGMKFSLKCQTDGLCLSVIHQRSGYTFTLTWIRHEDGGDGELMYRVSSLGTVERVALDWMKVDMVFSMTMCPVFFERISRVVGRS